MKKRFAIIVLLVVLLTSAALWWLGYTQSGLRFAIAQLHHIPKVAVKMTGISGRLAGPLHIDYLELDHERAHVVARQIDLDLNPALLLSGWIAVRATIDQVNVQLKPRLHPATTESINFLPGFLHVYANSVVVHHVTFVHYNGFTIQAAPVTTQLSLSRRHLLLSDLDVTGEWFAAKGSFQLDSDKTLKLESQLNAILKPAHGVPLQGNVGMKGDTSVLNFLADIQQPNQAYATATLSFPNSNWLISGHTETDRWLLTPWLDAAPLSFNKGVFDYTLDDAGLHVKGNVVVPEWATTSLHVDGDAQFSRQNANRVITLKRAEISEKISGIKTLTAGTITLANSTPGESTPLLDLQSSWSYLQWPIQAASQQTYFHTRRGNATLKGNMPYQFVVDAELDVRNVNHSTLSASGKLARDHIEVAQFDWHAWNGSVQGNAQLAYAIPRHWQFEARARDIDPSSLVSELPGHVSFTLQGKGADINHPESDFDVTLRNLGGILRKQPLHGQGHLVHHATEWQADQITLNWGDASLVAQGNAGVRNDIRWHLNAPALQQLNASVSGQMNMNGVLQGTRAAPRLSLTIQSDTFAYEDWKSTGVKLDTDIDLSDGSPSRLSLSAKQLAHGNYVLSQVAIDAQGQASSHEASLHGVLNSPITDDQQLDIKLHGRYENEPADKRGKPGHEKWLAQITHMDLKNSRLHAELDHSAELMVDRNPAHELTLALRDFCMHVDKGHACGSGEWQSNGPWQLQASINKWPVVLEHSANVEVTRLTTNIDATADIRRSSDQSLLGNAQLTLNDAIIRYQLGDHEEVLPITLGSMQLNADTHGITTNAALHIASDTVADFSATASHVASTELENWPLQGKLALRSEDAKLIPVFIHEVDRAGGVLNAKINLSGTLGTPQLNGTIDFNNGELDFYRWNLALRELQLNAQLNSDEVQFKAQGNAGQGTVNAEGNLNWRNQLTGKLQLHGEKLLVADSPEYHITASPALTFDIRNENGKGLIDVSGEILIPSAKLQPQAIVNAVQISSDAHFKDDALYTRDSVWRVNSNVTVKLGDDVHFDGLGLQGQLGGEVSTRLRTAVAASGRGELGISDGHYEAYGRKFDIKRGHLLFDNIALDNPGLDIQAERVINDVTLGDLTVGVNVRGFLRDPRLEFYSDPSMSQTQIVSYLIVGKPLDQLQSQETTTVRSATSSLALQGGGYLASQLGRRVGLEEVGVETNANNQSALVLGKFLSPRLYVSYGISLTQAINTLKLRYSVSKHWTLKTESGEAKSADVEFKIER